MKLYSWNVNGIRAVETKGELEKFIAEHDPDILCMQEIKAHPDQLDIKYDQYHKFWNPAEKKGYAGTAIWTKQEPLNVSYGFPENLISEYALDSDAYGDPSNEGRVLCLSFEEFYVVTVYTPNSKGDLSRLSLREKQWDPAFLQYVSVKAGKKPILFCGDLNVAHQEIDLARPKENVGKHGFTDEERRGFQNMLDAGFVDTLRLFRQGNGHYTWWSHFANSRARNVGWRIDYVLVSGALRAAVKAADIHADIMGSDHCPVSITLDI